MCDRVAGPRRPGDFGGARKECEDVTGVALAQKSFDCGGDLLFERRGGVRSMSDLEIEQAAFGAQNFASAQPGRQRSGIESCRHDDEAEIRTRGRLKTEQECESQVAVQVALVKLIQDDDGDAVESRIVEQLSGEDTFGEVAQASRRSTDFLKSNLIADGLADGLA